MTHRKEIPAKVIAEQVGGELIGAPDVAISGVASLAEAGPEHLSFLGNEKYRKQVATTQAGAVLVPRDFDAAPRDGAAFIRCDRPSESFSAYVIEFSPPPVVHAPGIHPQATIADGAVVPESAHIGPHVVIEPGARIGGRTVIGAGTYIGHGVTIGDDCHLYPNVSVRERCVVGSRVIIHCGSVIGSDGFGFEQDETGHRKIPQFGIVQVDDDVELGACVTIDRARFGRTWIKRGVKIDNLVQIAHNVVIGEGTIIVAQVGIAGSSIVGRGAILAGQVGIPGHITIGDRAVVMAKAGPMKDVEPGTAVVGYPALPRREFFRQVSYTSKLPDLVGRVKELEKQLAELKQRLADA